MQNNRKGYYFRLDEGLVELAKTKGLSNLSAFIESSLYQFVNGEFKTYTCADCKKVKWSSVIKPSACIICKSSNVVEISNL